MAAKFIDEINRLFEELVHSPWQPLGLPVGKATSTVSGDWWLDLPIQGAQCGDITFQTEGRQLTVALRRQRAQRVEDANSDVTTVAEEDWRQSFLLPEGSEIHNIEVHFEEKRVRIRVRLKKRAP